MKCFLRRLTSAVSFFLLLSLAFSLDLRGLAEKELRKAFGEEVRLESFRVLASRLPEDYDRVELKAVRGNPRGYLYIYRGNKVFSVALNLLWKCRVLIAKRDIYPGERLSKENTEGIYKYLKRCPKIPEGSLSNFVARKFIEAGSPIERKFLRKEFLVKRGERVRVFYESGSIRIEFESVAYDNGYYGDSVRVRSPFSEKLIRGTVVGEGIVKILD